MDQHTGYFPTGLMTEVLRVLKNGHAAKAYQRFLLRYGMICSVNRKGNCWDDSPMEIFSGRSKLSMCITKILRREVKRG
jgi:transposase InsO family protein